jgi:hypothetical protein
VTPEEEEVEEVVPDRMMDCTAATEFTRLEKIPSKKITKYKSN